MQLIDTIIGAIHGEGRSSVVLKNIIASFGLKGISIIVSFALVPMTIGYVSSELYGVWLTLSSILTWLHFLDIGFSQGLKNKLTEAIANDDWEKGKALVSTTYGMMIIIMIPVCLLLEIAIPFVDWTSLLNVDPIYSDEIAKAMYVCIAFACLQMIVNVLVSVVAAFQKVALSNSFMVIGNVISLLLIFILKETCPPSLVVLACTLAAMPILVTIIASVILYCGRFKRVAPSITCFNKLYIKDLFGLGYKFFIINIQVLVLYQSTNVLISNVSSPMEVTNYNIAYKLLNVAMMIYTIITAPLWPAYTDAYARDDYEWMNKMKKKMTKILLLSMVGCIFITLLSPFIYRIWVGDSVEVPFIMTCMVCLYVMAYCWMNLNGTFLVGMGKIKIETYITIIGMIVHIPLSYFLSRYIGCYGVILSMILINVFYAVIMRIQTGKILSRTATGIWNE